MMRSEKGIALILVVSILTVVAITVVSFIFTMRLESRAAANYLWQAQARYIAEAGITHALAVLKEDKANSFIDTYGDTWRSTFGGSDIDNDEDRKNDSRWIEVSSGGQLIGRYAVLVEDEAAKININAAGFHNESPLKVTQGATPFEVSLKDFLLAKDISSAQELSGEILNYRWGSDELPGAAGQDDNSNLAYLGHDGIDNDADGEIDEPAEGIDEPQEFVPYHPFDDDRPFLTSEEIKRISGVSSSIYNKIKGEITAYARAPSTDHNQNLQWDINNLDAQQLLDVLFKNGVSSPWQKAVNLADFADTDFAQSVVVRSVKKIYTRDIGPRGDWQWVGGHYQSLISGGTSGSWTWWGIPAGRYYLVIYGAQAGQDVGDVTIAGVTHRLMNSGGVFRGIVNVAEEPHPLFPEGGVGSLSLAIQNNEALGTSCFFKYIELSSAEAKVLDEVEEVRGAEGIRINEIMVKPQIELATTQQQSPGGDWFWRQGYYENTVSAGGAGGEGTWIWRNIPDGEYYLTVFAAEDGQLVGDVKASGATQEDMRSGERFSARDAVRVSSGIFRLDIRNNSSGSCYFKSILLSQQPDGEFIELVNLTPNEISLDGFSLEASGNDGWPGAIPLGTSIGPGEYLILAVDKTDSAGGLNGNGISFENIWGGLAAAQLDFSRSVTGYSDMLSDEPPGGRGEVILRDARGKVVDKQEYSSSQVLPYISLEKGDPTAIGEAEVVWFASAELSGATPADRNNNTGISEAEGEESILDALQVKNCALANLGELAQVSSGEAWQKMSLEDLMNLADGLTVYSLRLEAEGHKAEGGWAESLRSAPNTAWFLSQTQGEEGTWLWSEQERIPNGVYNLYLYGEDGEAFSVSLHLADGSWTAFTPAITPGANNGVSFGRIEIGTGSAVSLPAHQIELRLKNASASNIAHFDYVCLAPLPYVPGKLNINTASKEALQALPLIDASGAQRIINGRPFGDKENKGRGIGDVLSGDILDSDADAKITKFSAISNLITVRSHTYRIIATGQLLRNGRVMAEKRISTVIER
jgi:type II secretory pathway component PulK